MAILKGPVNPVVTGITTFPELDNIQVATPNRHSVRPSLVLDFANSKTLDPRITFTRGSAATYYDGSVAKAEENLLTNSQVFSGAPWTSVDNTTFLGNYATAPDGTATATKLVPTVTNALHRIFTGTVATSVTGWVTFSVFAKADGYTGMALFINGPDKGVVYDLSAGTATDSPMSPYTGATYSITAVGNSWYRCVITAFCNNVTVTNVQIQPWNSAGGSGTYVGNTTSGIAVWGAQCELRSSATTYTATTTSTITNYIPVLATAGSNQPRFDVDPVTKESKGLLIEDQKTNYVTYSEQFEHANWAKPPGTSVVSNVGIAPNGVQSADLLLTSTTGDFKGTVYESVSGNGITTLSVYAKASGKNWLLLIDKAGSVGSAWFNLSTGTIGTVIAGYSATMTSVGNGWYRCSTTAATGSFSYFQLAVVDADNSVASTTSAFNGILLWGAQAEATSHVSSYIATAASSVTRAVDNAYMTGSNFTSWYNFAEATLFAEVSHISSTSTDKRILEIAQALPDIRQYDWRSNSNYISSLQLGGAGDTLVSNVVSSGTYYKTAVSAIVGSSLYNIAGNGTIGTAATITRMFAPDTMFIGTHAGNSYATNGWIKKIAFYPKRLTNAELLGLTAA